MIPIQADLHTHTTCSDGVLSPEALVRKARLRGLNTLAITDHDTVSGVLPARKEAALRSITLLSGVELSVDFNQRELHLLGYCIDVEAPALKDYLAYYSAQRETRARAIVERLYTMGLRLDYDTLRATIPDAAIGRPHIARALVEAGYTRTTGVAFAHYLGDGRPADIPKELPPAATAIEVVHAAGGVCVLAHPGHWVSDREIYTLKEQGLDGVEIIHPSHDDMLTSFYTRLANKLSLLKSGGSDYHGKRQGDETNFGKTGLTLEQFERFRLGCEQHIR